MQLNDTPTVGKLSSSDADRLIEAEFEELKCCYLDVAARGPLPRSARHAAEAILTAQTRGQVPKAEWLQLVETTRARAAALIGVHPSEVAFTKNASEGLNIVGAGLGLARGDRVMIAPAAEHPNNILPWLWQAREHGAEVVSVAPRPGQDLEEALVAAIDDRTRLVAVTSVEFGTGRRTDLRAIGDQCRSRGIFLLVDAAQSSGVLIDDLANLPVDGWATATQKGLLSPYGLGLLFVRQEWAERLKPPFLARFSVDLDEAHEAADTGGGWTLRPGAGRFEIGNYNYLGLGALEASFGLLLRVGPDEVQRRALEAAAGLRSAMETLDIPTLSFPREHQSHILAIAEKPGTAHDKADVGWISSLSAALTKGGIVHTIRRGAVRLSTHIHVRPDMIERVIECATDWRKEFTP
jgi:cysteine desulfurase / selenocysteine lyase